MREMTNRVTFLTNIIFMILNNATFIVQWLLIFHLKPEIGGYAFREVMLLWALSASSFGLANILFHRAFTLSDLILNGKLDSYLVQPKNVLLSIITSSTSISAIGDFLYGYILLLVIRCSVKDFLLFTLFTVTGAIIFTAFATIAGSLSFWIIRGDMLADSLFNMMINFSLYPDTIFKNGVRLLLYSLIPVGFYVYMPLHVLIQFNPATTLAILCFAIGISLFAILVFYKGLKRYTSSSLMGSRI
jgi:ABC-2 type transport system permease protein